MDGRIEGDRIFGSEVVSGSLRNDSTVVCTVPGSGTSEVPVSLAQDGRRLEDTVNFQYFEAPTIAGISPSRGSVSGGLVVSVRGANLRGKGLVCRFWTTMVTGAGARLVTSTVVACVAPRYSGTQGKVTVEVSVNELSCLAADLYEMVKRFKTE